MNIFGYLERHMEIYIVNIFINQSTVTDVGGYFGNDKQEFCTILSSLIPPFTRF